MIFDSPDNTPIIRHVANLWSFGDTAAGEKPWPLERQIAEVKAAGFDGFSTWLGPEHAKLAQKNDLLLVGYFATEDPAKFPDLLTQNRDLGATHINVQLADHDTTTETAIDLAVELMEQAEKIGVKPAVEVHRDTCTETPEKTYALADGYQAITGELLPMTWDFSHLAVVKHLSPPYSDRLLIRPELVQRAQQFHFRPFNGHHCQVPVTDGKGNRTRELEAWLPFVEDTFRIWRFCNHGQREIFVVPEMGPGPGGYNLSCMPNAWEEAKALRQILDEAWTRSGGY